MRPRLRTWVHTVRYLRPVQIYGRLWFKFYRPGVDAAPPPDRRSLVGRWSAPVQRQPSLLEPWRFRFLNKEQALVDGFDWDDPVVPRLWRYNLHYFDDLNARDAPCRLAWHRELLLRWVNENPPAAGTGWEPYPLALRMVNWIKWALAGNVLSEECLHSLAVQARWLTRRLEVHLLGNHLFANAKALVFAGLFFSGREAARWLDKGLAILHHELPEQILDDGGQFERTPMYHALAVEDVLDLINLLQAYGWEVPALWLDVQARMLVWLAGMTHPDGEIALFNDAAFGIAPTWRDLTNYAHRLGLEPPHCDVRSLVHFPDTGYIRCQRDDAVLLLDVAQVGPDYLPGHAHADTCSFELSLYGRRVIVDTGTSTYEKNEARQRQRGTAAHNTVLIDGEDSSEVWGGFRVGRRARPFGLESGRDGAWIWVVCSHDGYRRLPGRPVHRREWRLGSRELRVLDRIEGGFRWAVARYHLHPDVTISLQDTEAGSGTLPDGRIFFVRIIQGGARLLDSRWHPEFNTSLPCRCLEVVFAGPEVEVHFTWE